MVVLGADKDTWLIRAAALAVIHSDERRRAELEQKGG